MNTRLTLFAVALATTHLPLHAGVYIETVERNAKTSAEKPVSTMQVQSGRARIDTAGGDRSATMIFRDGAMHILDAQRKTYMVFDKAAADRTAGAMNDAMAMMRAQMQNMPPEQRAMMENMMKQRGMSMPSDSAKQPVYDAKATGGSEQVAGRACKVWNITRDGAPWQQVCVVANGSVPGQDEFRAVADQMRALSEKMGEVAKQFGGNPWEQDSALAKKLGGVPFITRRYRDGALQPEETIVKVWRTQSIDAGRFDIPAGYTKQEIPNLSMPR
jgi:hypothetical protein